MRVFIMTNKLFKDVAQGSVFTSDGKNFVKTQEVRISCCKSVNACAADNSNDKVFIPADKMVQVNG